MVSLAFLSNLASGFMESLFKFLLIFLFLTTRASWGVNELFQPKSNKSVTKIRNKIISAHTLLCQPTRNRINKFQTIKSNANNIWLKTNNAVLQPQNLKMRAKQIGLFLNRN